MVLSVLRCWNVSFSYGRTLSLLPFKGHVFLFLSAYCFLPLYKMSTTTWCVKRLKNKNPHLSCKVWRSLLKFLSLYCLFSVFLSVGLSIIGFRTHSVLLCEEWWPTVSVVSWCSSSLCVFKMDKAEFPLETSMCHLLQPMGNSINGHEWTFGACWGAYNLQDYKMCLKQFWSFQSMFHGNFCDFKPKHLTKKEISTGKQGIINAHLWLTDQKISSVTTIQCFIKSGYIYYTVPLINSHRCILLLWMNNPHKKTLTSENTENTYSSKKYHYFPKNVMRGEYKYLS